MNPKVYLYITKRDDIQYSLTFVDSNSAAIDLTGSTVFFTAKKNKSDSDDDAVIRKTITEFDNPTTGIVILNLSNNDTNILPNIYYFDIQLKDSFGNISSIQDGILTVSQDITIRVS